MTNKGNGKMLTVVAGELKFTDTICGEQAHWTWEQEDFLWGVIRHKVNNNLTELEMVISIRKVEKP